MKRAVILVFLVLSQSLSVMAVATAEEGATPDRWAEIDTLDTGEMWFLPSQCRALPDGSIVWNSVTPVGIFRTTDTGETSQIAGEGDGPGELKSRLNHISVIEDTLFVHGFNVFQTELYMGERHVGSARHSFLPLAIARVGGSLFAFRHVGSVAFEAVLKDRDRLCRFVQVEADGLEWEELESYWPAKEGEGNPRAEYLRALSTRLLPRDEHSFYVVPLWGGSDILIVEEDGRIAEHWPIPTARARDFSLDEDDLVESGVVLKDADVDRDGTLILLAPDEDGTAAILALDSEGHISWQARVPDNLSCICEAADGVHLYVASAESGRLYRLRR